MPPVIRVVDVCKRFNLRHTTSIRERMFHFRRQSEVEDFWALRDVSLDLEQSHTLGLIGANGSGKTTLLKMIGGILTPTSGYVERRGRVAALLELGAGFHQDLTGRENVYLNASILGLTRKQTDQHFDAMIDFSGIERFIDNQVKYYSSGMYVRLAFAVAVHVDPEILLVDEVLAVGDEPFQRKCMTRIKQFQADGRSIIFVTHGLDIVRDLCDHVVMLEKGQIVVNGKPHEAVRAYRDRYAPDVELTEATAPKGTGEVAIRDPVITDGEGAPKIRFEPGDQFVVEFVIDPKHAVDDPIVGFEVYNHLSVLVFGTNSQMRGVPLGRVDSPRRVRFRCPRLPLQEGRYTVTVAVAASDRKRIYQWLDQHISFRVIGGEEDVGLVNLDTRIEVLSAP